MTRWWPRAQLRCSTHPRDSSPNGNRQPHNSARKRPQQRQGPGMKGSAPELDYRNCSGVFRQMARFSVLKTEGKPGSLFQLPQGRPFVRFLVWVPIYGSEGRQGKSTTLGTQAKPGPASSQLWTGKSFSQTSLTSTFQTLLTVR